MSEGKPEAALSPRRWRVSGFGKAGTPAWLAGLAVLAATTVFLSHEFARDAGRVASIWPLNALLLAIAFRCPEASPFRVLAVGIAANIAVDVAMGDTLLKAVALSLVNLLEILICMKLLQRPGTTFDISRPADLIRFIFVGGGIGPLASALVAAVVLSGATPFHETLSVWFAADALGMLIFAPALMSIGAGSPRGFERRSAFEWAIGTSILVATLLLVFGQKSYPLLFLVPPALILATFRGGITATAASIILTALAAIAFSLAGYGPTQLISGSETERVLILQAFLAVMTLTSLPVAAALAEGERANASLRTAREEAEGAKATALASETHYRTLADNSTDIVVRFGKGGIISYVSPACRILGISPDQAVGRSTIDFAVPEDRAFAAKTVEDLFSGAEPDRSLRREFRVRCADGSFIWLEGSPNIIRNIDGDPVEVVSTYRDVTARRQLEGELRFAHQAARGAIQAVQASEIRFRAMADVSSDMIARMDMNGTIHFVSTSCESVMGYSPQALIGTTTLSHTHPDDVDMVKAFFTSLAAEGPDAPPRPYTFRAKRGDGRIIWLEGIPRILFDESGKPREIQDSARDVTARKELEQALAEARTAAEVAARAKADFLANMSHELRTPLNSIIGFTQLLAKSEALPRNERRHLELIAASSEGLSAIVNDILDFSSLELGAIRLEKRAFSSLEALRRSIDSLRVQADVKNLTLDLEIVGPLEPRLVGDKVRLHQILLNLVGNAVKFTRRGGVQVAVRASPPRNGQQALRFEVRDTGIGIPADQRDRLFVRFSQLDSSINRRFGGSGLGLAITKSLVDLMGGRIGVDSVEGEGATFWFELEFGVAAEAAFEAKEQLGASSQQMASRGKRILVVDDVDTNRELASACLAGHSHHVDHAPDGAEAVRLVQLSRYDIVFMDVQMPGMDGLAATRAIRSLPGLDRVPIIAMTAQALPNQIAACYDAGMNDYLAKPLALDSLTAMISKWAVAAETPPAGSAASDAMTSLRNRFVQRSRVDLKHMTDALSAGDVAASAEIHALIHRFAGTAGTLGFADVGAAALALDEEIAQGHALSNAAIAAFVRTLERTFEAA